MNGDTKLTLNQNMQQTNNTTEQQTMVQQPMVQQPVVQQPMVQQPMTLQPGMTANGIQIGDPMEILIKAPTAKIVQQIELLEIVSQCETNNRYDVFCEMNGVKYFCFRCKEDSSWCMRNMCPSDLRSFKINMMLPGQKKFGILERPFKCTCCCCARPIVKGTFSNGQPFGTINQPFTCCSPFFETVDETDGSKYSIEIPYCQCGFMCRSNVCGKCSEVIGNIYKENDLTHPVGTFKKLENCVQEMVSDANSFEIIFPTDATVGDKLNILATVILIDYRYYESKPSSNQHSRRSRRGGYRRRR
jgi:hypothetical protein